MREDGRAPRLFFTLPIGLGTRVETCGREVLTKAGLDDASVKQLAATDHGKYASLVLKAMRNAFDSRKTWDWIVRQADISLPDELVLTEAGKQILDSIEPLGLTRPEADADGKAK